jgi:hypothetical protein
LHDYRLTISSHIDAPRLARVFTRGVIEELEITEDARTAVILMVSDAASDSVRSGHPVTVTGTHVGSGCLLTVEGSELAQPTVTSMPEGLTVASDQSLLEIRIGGV